jgi:D-3-phosphoglycerate dehydrogenase
VHCYIRRANVARAFKVVIERVAGSGDVAAGAYDLEMEALRPIGAEIVAVLAPTGDDFMAEARDADALIGGKTRISRAMIDGLQRCKLIAVGSVGTDNVDVPAATDRGIPVTNVPDTFIDEVADHTMTLILATFRRLTLMDRMVRDGRWSEGRPFLYSFPRLMGQTLGFISFGHVARAVAARVAPFGLHMLAYDPYIEELTISRYGVEPVGLTEVLQRSDIVSMHAPGSDETENMLTEEHFRLMKPHALFINNGRGSTVDEAALIRALEERWIAGAGLDVLDQEPPEPENPLLHMENVILSPHVASASARFEPQRRRRVGREIALALTGRWPMACVNPSVLEKSALRRWQPYSMERGPAR